MPLYRILWTAPVTERAGETIHEDGKQVKPHRVIAWPCRGTIQAKDEFQALARAKAEYGGSPVIEQTEQVIHYV